MSELARANGIAVVLCSTLPSNYIHWKPEIVPTEKVKRLDAWLADYARKHGCVYVDYYSAMVDDKGGTKAELTKDGVHPNLAGYGVMAPLVEAGIARALEQH
jgi:lysophospholipase L1-like esterase